MSAYLKSATLLRFYSINNGLCTVIQTEVYSITIALFAKPKDWKKLVLISGELVKCFMHRTLRQG